MFTSRCPPLSISKQCFSKSWTLLKYPPSNMGQETSIDVGTVGALRARTPPRFCNKQRNSLFDLENIPCFLMKKYPRSVVTPPPKFEVLPTSLETSEDIVNHIRILLVKNNSFLSYVFPQLELLDFPRSESYFLISSFS